MEFAIAKVSTKGQIVIPRRMRENIKAGDEFLFVKDDERIVLKAVKDVAADLLEDVRFAQRMEQAFAEIDAGQVITESKEEFLERLSKL